MNQVIQASLYDYPKYYDLVYGSDWKAEFDFLVACFENLAGRTVRRVFEPACGTGRLMYRLAKAGCEVSGLDLNPRAVDYCNRRLERHGFPASAFVGDMADFRLPRKVDAAFNTIGSFRHLVSGRAAQDHLQCIANCLNKGGLYVLGFHLTPTVGQPLEEESWSARRGHLCVNTYMWTAERNLRRREERLGMTCDVYTPTKTLRLNEEIIFRTYTKRQFEKLVSDVPELEIAKVFDFHYEFENPVELGPETEDAVFILRKR
ncbi:MAG: class I SAM-dependent methyltransferase [Planctomycetes bacterium]|nr:class I SAM-dependent methyltransferase [Planctomycetota bacterium]MBL7039291.1 class I SAM-dependent methyltransferase [Pirellulaceae bacterium]